MFDAPPPIASPLKSTFRHGALCWTLTIALTTLPHVAGAVGYNDDDEDVSIPTPTETTTECEVGTIWDDETETCIAPEESSNGQQSMIRNVRELSYAGRYEDAAAILNRMDQQDGWVLTYRGFLARKNGDLLAAKASYRAAIRRDPNNLLARSYMAQGLVEEGKVGPAMAQLVAIQRRGGAGTWAEAALIETLQSGKGPNY